MPIPQESFRKTDCEIRCLAAYQIRMRRNCSFFPSAPLSFSPPRGTGRGWGWGCPSTAIMIQTQPETISRAYPPSLLQEWIEGQGFPNRLSNHLSGLIPIS